LRRCSFARCEREACPVRRYGSHEKVGSPSQTGYNTINERIYLKRVSQQIIESVRPIEKVLSTNNVATLQRRFCVPSASRSLAGRKLASGTSMFNAIMTQFRVTRFPRCIDNSQPTFRRHRRSVVRANSTGSSQVRVRSDINISLITSDTSGIYVIASRRVDIIDGRQRRRCAEFRDNCLLERDKGCPFTPQFATLNQGIKEERKKREKRRSPSKVQFLSAGANCEVKRTATISVRFQELRAARSANLD